MISYPQLKYIVELDNKRHFVAAAEACFVTQPTLSMQLKKLEEQLGVEIFDRSNQPIVPTPIGRKIIAQAKLALAENKKIHAIIEDFQQKMEGELRIGIIPSLAPYLLPLFIGNFVKKYPKLKVHVSELLSEDIIEKLQKEELDIGILATPLHEKQLVERLLFYEKILLYVNPSHSYAKRKILDSSDLNADGMWMLSKGHCFRSQVLNLCSMQEEVSEQVGFHYESGSLESIKKFVQKEGGYTLMPELALSENVENIALIAIENSPLREISMVHNKNFLKNHLLEKLSEEIKSAVPIEMLNSSKGQRVEWRS